jgi:hypothetical protein
MTNIQEGIYYPSKAPESQRRTEELISEMRASAIAESRRIYLERIEAEKTMLSLRLQRPPLDNYQT